MNYINELSHLDKCPIYDITEYLTYPQEELLELQDNDPDETVRYSATIANIVNDLGYNYPTSKSLLYNYLNIYSIIKKDKSFVFKYPLFSNLGKTFYDKSYITIIYNVLQYQKHHKK